MTHTSLAGNASRISLIAVVLLSVYLGGFALLRANCVPMAGGSFVVLPQCLHHSPNLNLSGDKFESLRWLIVTAYQPLLQIDMKLTKRSYLRAPLWSGWVIEPWF